MSAAASRPRRQHSEPWHGRRSQIWPDLDQKARVIVIAAVVRRARTRRSRRRRCSSMSSRLPRMEAARARRRFMCGGYGPLNGTSRS